MSKLFEGLLYKNKLENCVSFFDWLFDDNRFSTGKGWTNGYVGQFIKKVKKITGISDKNYTYNSIKKLEFSNHNCNDFIILHSKRDGESRDLVRHIRNSVAHGKASLRIAEGKLYIEMYDYNTKNDQTAYLFIPFEHLLSMHKIYKEIEESINNSTKKKRRR